MKLAFNQSGDNMLNCNTGRSHHGEGEEISRPTSSDE